jgi:hypothetical protein
MAKQKDAAAQAETNATKAQNGKPAEEKPQRISVSDAAMRVIKDMSPGTEADADTLAQAVKEMVEESGGQVTAERARADLIAYAWTAAGFGIAEVVERITIKKTR